MRDFNYELKRLVQRHPDGSYATRADRERILDLIANQLQEMGFRNMHATSLKPRHVEALVARWHGEQIAPATFKNRMAQLRWLAEMNRQAERHCAFQRRLRHSRAYLRHQCLEGGGTGEKRLERVTNPYTALSLRLQAAFGLRREESIKFQPAWADRGDRIVLQLQACRQDVLAASTALRDKWEVPLNKLAPAHIQKFTRVLRARLLDTDSGFGKAYLNLLVDEIRLDVDKLHIQGSYSTLARAVSLAKEGKLDTVPSFVPKWRPEDESNVRPAP